MDISNISAMYQNYNQTAAGSMTGNQISQLQGKDMSQATDEELMDACKEFEAYFMEQVMKEMIKTTKLDGEDESSNTMVDYFKDTAIADLAKESTEQNSLGLAQMLYEQMKRNTGSV
jgi:peptidoglycan hydrolase